jgi:hypothetical protein
MAASSLAYIIRSSLGPNGLAKMIIDEHSKYVLSCERYINVTAYYYYGR